MDKKIKNTGENIKIAAGVLGLVVLFAAAAVAFYMHRDAIYVFLRGETKEAGAAKENKSGQNPPRPSSAANPSDSFEPFDPFDPFEPLNLSGYFKNIIFLGDSIVSGLEFCKDSAVVDGEKVLRDATVVAAVNYSLKNAVSEISENSVNLTYAGKAMKPEDIVSQMDHKYVFVCLGLNDFYGTPLDEYIENYGRLVKNIQAKSPDKAIAVLSVTPLVAGQKHGFMTNQVITEANSRLMEFAADNDIYFIDWAAAIRDENDALYESLCSDGFCHLNPEAYRRLAEYLAGILE